MQFISELYSKLSLVCTMGWILQVVSHLCTSPLNQKKPPPALQPFFFSFFDGIAVSQQTSDFTFRTSRPVVAEWEQEADPNGHCVALWMQLKQQKLSRASAASTYELVLEKRGWMSQCITVERPAGGGLVAHLCLDRVILKFLNHSGGVLYMQAEATVVFLSALVPCLLPWRGQHLLFSTAHH